MWSKILVLFNFLFYYHLLGFTSSPLWDVTAIIGYGHTFFPHRRVFCVGYVFHMFFSPSTSCSCSEGRAGEDRVMSDGRGEITTILKGKKSACLESRKSGPTSSLEPFDHGGARKLHMPQLMASPVLYGLPVKQPVRSCATSPRSYSEVRIVSGEVATLRSRPSWYPASSTFQSSVSTSPSSE